MKLNLLFSLTCLAIVSLFSAHNKASAQSGLDTGFGTNGEVITNIPTTNPGFLGGGTAIELSDGKLLVAGHLEANGGPNDNQGTLILARYNSNGSLDTSFGVDGISSFQINATSSFSGEAIVDASGRILIVGYTINAPDQELAFLARLNANGTLDTTFGTNGIVTTTFGTTMLGTAAFSVVLQADGNIVIAGATVSEDDPTFEFIGDFALARYTASGTLDTTFGNSGYVLTDFNPNSLDVVYALNLQPDGKIVAVGNSELERRDNTQETAGVVAARYNPDGSLDSTFGTSGLTSVEFTNLFPFVEDSKLQPDGKIIIVGELYDFNNNVNTGFFLIVRLNADGNLDTSFDTDGIVTTSFGANHSQFATAVNILSDNSIIVNGDVFNSGTGEDFLGIAKYLSNGALDLAFRDNGTFLFSRTVSSGDAVITNDTNLLVVGAKAIDPAGNNFNDDIYLAKLLLSNTLGTDDLTATTIKLYPNPAKDVLNFNLGTVNTPTDISIINILGKQVFSIKTQNNLEALNIASLPSGMYLVKVTQQDVSKTFKVLKT